MVVMVVMVVMILQAAQRSHYAQSKERTAVACLVVARVGFVKYVRKNLLLLPDKKTSSTHGQMQSGTKGVHVHTHYRNQKR